MNMNHDTRTENELKGSEEHKVIPIRRVPFTDHSQLPSDFSATPGGTLFSTTPGGTRIIYDRNFLIQCRDSPLAKTPPTNLPDIPGVTRPIRGKQENGEESIKNRANAEKHLDDPQFHMDI